MRDAMFDNDSPIDIKEYQDYLTGEEFRKQQIIRLSELHREGRSLKHEQFGILSAFTDHEKNKRLFGVVNQVWGCVLDADTQKNTVEEIVSMSLNTEDDYVFLTENRNKQHFPSVDIFEQHIDHPIQKKLTKTKHISKRATKKQKTPMQTISYVYSAKSNSDRDARLLALEEQMKDAHYKISLLALNQVDIMNHSDTQSLQIQEVQSRLSVVEETIKDQRKLKLYALHTSEKKPSTKELSKELGVNVRTVRRWLVELRQQGFIS